MDITTTQEGQMVSYTITITGEPNEDGYPHNRVEFDSILDALRASGFGYTVDLNEAWGDRERLYTRRLI
jgi:hypothetical protein